MDNKKQVLVNPGKQMTPHAFYDVPTAWHMPA